VAKNQKVAAVVTMVACLGCASSSEDTTVLDLSDTDAVEFEAARARNDARLSELIARGRELEAQMDPALLREIEEWNRTQVPYPIALNNSRAQPLAPAERAAIEAYLLAQGVDLDKVTFSGRIFAHDDLLFEADRILHAIAPTRDKGSLIWEHLTGVSGPNNVPNWEDPFVRCSGDASPTAAVDEPPGTNRVCLAGEGNPQYWRPNVEHPYFVIVPGSSPAFPLVKNMAITVVGEIEQANSSADCLNNDTFTVVTEGEFSALPLTTQVASHKINISYGDPEEMCGDDDSLGCAVMPRIEGVFVGQAFQQRMAFGTYLGLSNTQTLNTEKNRGILMHEFLHTMGFAHPPIEAGSKLYVPGTSTSLTVPSVMLKDEDTRPLHPTADDKDMLRTLLPSSSGCSYVHNFRTIVAVP
jgi:hypothetical protein